MRIKSVTIENFKTIKHLDFKLRDLSLLVGPNNAGKSNIIGAIRHFFGDTKQGIIFRDAEGEDVEPIW